MGALELQKNIYYVGVKDPDLKVFDIIMSTEFGTTYNAYLVKGEKSALIETAHNKLVDLYLENIEQVQSVKDIDYVICNHTEPDHSGSLIKLLEINPDIEVIGTTAAIKNLKEITNTTFKEHVVKDGEELDLGDGVILKFIIAPNLHWPDTMMTYIESAKTLFSCDFLGAHYCEMGITDEEIINEDGYNTSFKQYYDAILSPFNQFVVKGLEKIQCLDIKMVCTSHGPVLKKFVNQNLEKYAKWSKTIVHDKKQASIFYVSAYGYTKKMAEVLSEELEEKGIEVFVYNVIESDKSEMIKKLNSCDVVLFGTPTINRNALEPIWNIIASIDMINARNKAFAVFGSYGWSGEGCPLIEQNLKALKLKVFETPITSVFNPSNDKIEELRGFAGRLADCVLA